MKKIFAVPAYSNATANPYNSILSNVLRDRGWVVTEPSLLDGLFTRSDIYHIHWPQSVFNEKGLVFLRRSLLQLAVLAIQRFRGSKIVWTAHNIESHEVRRPRFERLYMLLVIRLLDGVIFLDSGTRDRAVVHWPKLANIPNCLDPHLLYGETYPRSSERLPYQLAFAGESDTPVVGFIGDIKAYKGVEEFILAILSLEPGSVRGVVAGQFRDPVFANETRAKIADGNANGWKIALFEKRLTSQELVDALEAIDLLVLPYKTESNSGLAFLAAERGIPMLLKNSKPFTTLRDELDTDLVETFGGLLSGRTLETLAWKAARRGRYDPPDTFMETHAPVSSGARTDRFFRQLLGG